MSSEPKDIIKTIRAEHAEYRLGLITRFKSSDNLAAQYADDNEIWSDYDDFCQTSINVPSLTEQYTNDSIWWREYITFRLDIMKSVIDATTGFSILADQYMKDPIWKFYDTFRLNLIAK